VVSEIRSLNWYPRNFQFASFLDTFNMMGMNIPIRSPATQIAFRFRAIDSPAGVTRATVTRLANLLDVNETQVIHLALRDMALKILPHYEADGGPLTTTQINQIKQLVPQIKKQSVRSSLIQLLGGSSQP
jgi:hypothetical protein